MADAKPARLAALDVLRGLAVAGMILVTSPGDWSSGYAPLHHADWNGWTPTDLIFPTFLFSVGMALALSFPRALDTAEARSLFWSRVGRRVALLILLGLALNLTAEYALEYWMKGRTVLGWFRIPGILQRIALCYLIGAALIVFTARRDPDGRSEINPRAIAIAIAAILLGYWALLTLVPVPVPGFGAGQLTPTGSLTGHIDQMVFTPPHLWFLGAEKWGGIPTYDPEGLLSTLPAATNMMFGILAALAMRRMPERAVVVIAGAGVALIIAGLLLDPLFVINKRLWTSSFALLSSGFSALILSALIVALRSPLANRAAAPLYVLGGNAILAFTVSILLGQLGGSPVIPQGDVWTTPQKWGYETALGLIPDPDLASLACAMAIVALITVAIWPLHRRGIHLRL